MESGRVDDPSTNGEISLPIVVIEPRSGYSGWFGNPDTRTASSQASFTQGEHEHASVLGLAQQVIDPSSAQTNVRHFSTLLVPC